jgi:flagellar biosynthesis protein FlhG
MRGQETSPYPVVNNMKGKKKLDQASALREMKKRESAAHRGVTLPAFDVQNQSSPKRRVRVIAVTSGKGGVGKTNLSVNLAYFLTKLKKKVLMLDADVGLANIDVILGLTPQYNLYHVLRGEKSIREIMVEGPGGMLILPASSGIQEMTNLSQGNRLSLIDEIKTLQDRVDFMLIDTGAGIASHVMYFNMAAQEIIVVTTPEPTAITDAYALIKVLHQRHAKEHFRLLVNMVKTEEEAKEVFTRLNQATNHFLNISVEYFGHVAYDGHISDSIRKQQPFVTLFPDTPAAKCLWNLATKLAKEERFTEVTGTPGFFWDAI